MIAVTAVQPEDVARWKEPLSWHFDSFCRDGSLTPAALWADIESKQRQLWVLEGQGGIAGAVLTAVVPDELKTCDVTHTAGRNRQEWQHLWPALEHWAREIGCTRIRALCRPGWKPHLEHFGLKQTHVIMEAAL